MSIGANTRRLRIDAGLTQAALAAQIGIGTSMLCQIERGTKTLTLPLAILDNRSIAEMAVVWSLDNDGDTYSGSYFCNFSSAQKEFFARACGGIYK